MNLSANHASEDFSGSNERENMLLQYIQSLSPETVGKLSQPSSSEVYQIMERNIMGLLGGLPAGQFEVTVTTNREHLGRLLASAMMSGYFLHNAEQRLEFERSLHGSTLETEV
jgi:hypothetical protein